MTVQRRTYVKNVGGVTDDFVRKRLAPGEQFEINNRDLDVWRDEPTISGVIASGILEVSNGYQTFPTVSGAAEGIKWFYNFPTELPAGDGGAAQQDPDGEFVTINRARFGFGKNGNTDNAYLRVEGASSGQTGHLIIRPARITGLAAYYPTGAGTKTLEIRKNGDTTSLHTFAVNVDEAYIEDNLSIDLDKADRLQVFVTGPDAAIKNPNVWMEVAWRADT